MRRAEPSWRADDAVRLPGGLPPDHCSSTPSSRLRREARLRGFADAILLDLTRGQGGDVWRLATQPCLGADASAADIFIPRQGGRRRSATRPLSRARPAAQPRSRPATARAGAGAARESRPAPRPCRVPGVGRLEGIVLTIDGGCAACVARLCRNETRAVGGAPKRLTMENQQHRAIIPRIVLLALLCKSSCPCPMHLFSYGD